MMTYQKWEETNRKALHSMHFLLGNYQTYLAYTHDWYARYETGRRAIRIARGSLNMRDQQELPLHH